MRIALIRPNSQIVACPPPLGLGYLAGYLLKRRKDQVLIIDARRHRLKIPRIIDQLKDFSPELVGITALSAEAIPAHNLAQAIKKSFPEIPLIIGGPYPTSLKEEILKETNFDFAVVGEGEETFFELVQTLEQGGALNQVKGLVLRSNQAPHFTGFREPIAEIDELEIEWNLLEPESYFSWRVRTSENTLRRSARLLPIFTSRGCPFSCYFCHNIFGKKFRARSPEAVLKEIDFLVERYRIKELEIVDDSFNLDLARAKEILRKLAQRPYQLWLSFPNGIRADRVDEELLDLLKQAGTYRIDYAIESANPSRQKEMGKNLNLEKARWVIEQTWEKRILSAGYFILGFPGETEEEMKKTIRFALKSRLQVASFFYLNPFPSTPLVENSPELKKKSQEIKNWDYSSLNLNISAVEDARLRKIRKWAYRRFYFSPFRLWSNLVLAPKNFRTLKSIIDIIRLSFRDSVNY